jgi:tetratricopeptide (TPR) repeat protein
MADLSDRLADANRCLQGGQPQQAEEIVRPIVHAEPHRAEAWHLLGMALGRQERWSEAADCFRRLRDLHPTAAEPHANLGIALLRLGRFEEAITNLRTAVCRRPDYALAHNSLANALAAQGRLDEAIASLREAIRIRPDFVEAHVNLAIWLLERDQIDEAMAASQHAIRLRPNIHEAYIILGGALKHQGRLEEAITCFQQALALRPHSPEAHHNWGVALAELGDAEEAAAHYREALRVRPDYSFPFYGLGELVVEGRSTFTSEEQNRLTALLNRQELPIKDRFPLHFIMGGLLDRQGAYDEAFGHFRKANELRGQFFQQRGQGFDAVMHHQAVAELISKFDPQYFRRAQDAGSQSDLPVFIVGMPRSGTSLVEHILASHPLVHGAGELSDICMLSVGVTPESAGPAAERYLQRLAKLAGRARAANVRRITDKHPLNYLHLGTIFTLFPKARVIHCRRDARDACLSCYMQNFKNYPFTASLEHLGHYYRAYENLMAHWRKVLPQPLCEVDYEELVSSPEDVSRRLVTSCGLEWDARCLNFHATRRTVQTMSKFQVRQPIYTRSVGRWKHYEKHLDPLLAALGSTCSLSRVDTRPA